MRMLKQGETWEAEQSGQREVANAKRSEAAKVSRDLTAASLPWVRYQRVPHPMIALVSQPRAMLAFRRR